MKDAVIREYFQFELEKAQEEKDRLMDQILLLQEQENTAEQRITVLENILAE